MKLNLSHFKKVSADKDMAILKHKDGHEMRIAIKALDAKSRGEIARMETHKEDKKPDADQGKKIEMPIRKDKEETGKKPSAQQGEFLMMADGGEVPANDDVGYAMQSLGLDKAGSAFDLPAEPVASTSGPQPGDPSYQGAAPTIAASAPIEQPTAPTLDQGQLTSQQGLAAPQSGLAQGAQAPITPGQPQTSDSLGIGSAMDLMTQGEQLKAQAEGALGKQQAAIQDKLVAQQQEVLQHFNEVGKDINNEITNVIQDYKAGHIDPNRYVNSMSTTQKISSAIGLIAGGIGSALIGQQNPAMKFLEDQINRDVDAQKADMDKKFNLVSAYTKQFGNVKDATDMARLSLGAITAAKMEAAAAQSKDPLAKARLMTAIGEMRAKYAPLVVSMQAVQTINKAANAGAQPSAIAPVLDQLRTVNPERAKEIEARYVPGVGIAQVPVTPEVRKELVAKTNLVRSAAALRDWVKVHGHSADPKVRAEGETLAAELQQIYRQGVGGSTSEGEQKVIEKIIDSDPGKILTMTVDPKLQALEHSMTRSLNTLKQQYQLPTQSVEQQRAGQLPPEQQQFAKWAMDPRNEKNPKAQMILKKLGLK